MRLLDGRLQKIEEGIALDALLADRKASGRAVQRSQRQGSCWRAAVHLGRWAGPRAHVLDGESLGGFVVLGHDGRRLCDQFAREKLHTLACASMGQRAACQHAWQVHLHMWNNCSEAAGDGIVTGESQRGRGDAADVIVSLHQLLDFCGRKFGLLHGVWLGALWRARREV